ncbi:MAG: methyltransferase [Flavobacteriales bacterium]|nr:methyltransferase [Flavobacteriales bacterium]
MKVTEDAVIMGAWCGMASAKWILDIGTGTGLLALMMAQQSAKAQVDAIEIDTGAAEQAHDNFKNSPWSNRLHLIKGDFREVIVERKYDLIVCNPQFYTADIQSPVATRALARSEAHMPLADWVPRALALLHPDGKLVTMLPLAGGEELRCIAQESGGFASRQLTIMPRMGMPAGRIVVELTFGACQPIVENLIVREESGTYSESFKKLTSAFYLAL